MTKPGLFRVSHDTEVDVFALDTGATEARVPVLSAGVVGGAPAMWTSPRERASHVPRCSPVSVRRESSSATVEQSLVLPARGWGGFSIVGLENQ